MQQTLLVERLHVQTTLVHPKVWVTVDCDLAVTCRSCGALARMGGVDIKTFLQELASKGWYVYHSPLGASCDKCTISAIEADAE